MVVCRLPASLARVSARTGDFTRGRSVGCPHTLRMDARHPSVHLSLDVRYLLQFSEAPLELFLLLLEGFSFADIQRLHQVEYWRWRYRHPKTGQTVQTIFQLTAVQAAKYPGAEPIEGSRTLRNAGG